MDEDGRILIQDCSCTCTGFTGKHLAHILALRMQQSIPQQIACGDVSFVPQEPTASDETIESLELIEDTLAKGCQDAQKGSKEGARRVQKNMQQTSVEKYEKIDRKKERRTDKSRQQHRCLKL